mmetsp:Transcript_44107/g.101064  ORF Transcript_44107/g.101064 Transcript_44107/m.101064 type:complete len:222 (+) Transcript_44107:1104-1769(+)
MAPVHQHSLSLSAQSSQADGASPRPLRLPQRVPRLRAGVDGHARAPGQRQSHLAPSHVVLAPHRRVLRVDEDLAVARLPGERGDRDHHQWRIGRRIQHDVPRGRNSALHCCRARRHPCSCLCRREWVRPRVRNRRARPAAVWLPRAAAEKCTRHSARAVLCPSARERDARAQPLSQREAAAANATQRERSKAVTRFRMWRECCTAVGHSTVRSSREFCTTD